MKKLFAIATAIAALGFVGSAQAADMPVKARTAPLQYSNWTGFYVGVNAGGAWANVNQDNTPIVPFSGSAKPDGYFIGGTVGYNWQINSAWVLGLEADFQGSRISGDVLSFTAFADTVNVSSWGTARARIGYAGWDHNLLYLTGGWAWAHVDGSFPSVLGFGSTSSTFNGWTIGAGMEHAITSNWSVKAEYLYLDLGSKTLSYSGLGPIPFNTKLTMNVARVGVNYKW